MKRFLESKINWKLACLSVVIFALFIALILPKISEYTEENIGGTGSPDTDMMYTGEELYEIAESYGEDGRETYVYLRWTFDLIWPLVYTFFLLSFIIILGKDIKYKFIKPLYMMPIISMVMDYLENTLVTVVMVGFPKQMLILGSIASVVSLLKWVTLSLAFVCVFVVAGARLVWKMTD